MKNRLNCPYWLFERPRRKRGGEGVFLKGREGVYTLALPRRKIDETEGGNGPGQRQGVPCVWLGF